MGYVQLALACLQLANMFVSWAKQSQALKAGEDEALAKASASILSETQVGKAMLAKTSAMGEGEVDKELKGLEP